MDDLYIAMIPAKQIYSHEDWSTGLAVYYDPGSVSTASHETLSYCFLKRRFRGSHQVWSQYDVNLKRALTRKAVRLVDRERRRVDANLPSDWPGDIHPEMHHWAKKLYRLRYFEPEHDFVESLLGQAEAGHLLSDKQTAVVKEMYQERGGVPGLRKRHRLQRRLRKLAELEMEPDDEETVRRFLRYTKTAAGLRESKEPVIGALENQYWRQRLDQTTRRAEQIAVLLKSGSEGENY